MVLLYDGFVTDTWDGIISYVKQIKKPWLIHYVLVGSAIYRYNPMFTIYTELTISNVSASDKSIYLLLRLFIDEVPLSSLVKYLDDHWVPEVRTVCRLRLEGLL